MNVSPRLTVLSADPRRGHGPLALVAAGSLAAVLLNLLLLYDVSSLLTGNIRAIVGDIVDTWEPSCWATLGLFVVFTVLAFLQAAFRCQLARENPPMFAAEIPPSPDREGKGWKRRLARSA